MKYFKKANQYLYEDKDNKTNNLLHIYAIAFIKIYCKYYVEINYNHFNNCNFEEINKMLNEKDEKNISVRNIRNLCIFRVYCKKFENFDKFENYDFNKKNVSIYEEIVPKLLAEKNQTNSYIFKERFITTEKLSFI